MYSYLNFSMYSYLISKKSSLMIVTPQTAQLPQTTPTILTILNSPTSPTISNSPTSSTISNSPTNPTSTSSKPTQPLFDFYPKITQIKQNQPNQDYSKTILRPPKDHPKTSLRQLKQIKQFLLIKQFQLTKQFWQN